MSQISFSTFVLLSLMNDCGAFAASIQQQACGRAIAKASVITFVMMVGLYVMKKASGRQSATPNKDVQSHSADIQLEKTDYTSVEKEDQKSQALHSLWIIIVYVLGFFALALIVKFVRDYQIQ